MCMALPAISERKYQRKAPKFEALGKSELVHGSLDNPGHVRHAVKIIKSGGIAVFEVWGVFGIWGRADRLATVERMFAVKDETGLKKTLSAMMSSQHFLPLIDKDSVHPDIKHLVKDHHSLREHSGAFFFVGANIRKEAAKKAPTPLISYDEEGNAFMYNLDPYGHDYMSNLIEQIGIPWVGVMSLNTHDKPSIHDYQVASEFCRAKGIPLILRDPSHRREKFIGSFAQVDIRKKAAVRDGKFPVSFINKTLGTELYTGQTKKAQYPQTLSENLKMLLTADMGPAEVRRICIDYVTGRLEIADIEKIILAQTVKA